MHSNNSINFPKEKMMKNNKNMKNAQIRFLIANRITICRFNLWLKSVFAEETSLFERHIETNHQKINVNNRHFAK